MEIEFDFEMNDWMEFQKFHLQNSKQYARTRLIATLLVPVLLVVFSISYFQNGGSSLTPVIIFGLVSIGWVLFYPKRLFNRTMDKARKILEEGDNSGILGLHKLMINAEGLVHIQPESEQKLKWTGIKKVDESEDHYFLFVSALSAIIIPKRKIESNVEELDQVLKTNIA